MFIIHFDLVAIVLCLFLLFINNYKSPKRDRNYSLFNFMLIVTLIATIGDLGSGFGSNFFSKSTANRGMLYFFNYLYFFAHTNILTIFFIYCFSVMELWHVVKATKWAQITIMTVVIIQNFMIVLNFFNNCIFYINRENNYCRGDWIIILYLSALVMISICTGIALKYKSIIRADKFYVLILTAPLYVVALIIQGIWIGLAIEMFVIALEITLFFITVQRDEEYVDPRIGAKTYSTAFEKIKRYTFTKTPVSILFLKGVNFKNISAYLGQDMYDECLKLISTTLVEKAKEKKLNAGVFYMGRSLYCLMAEGADEKDLIEISKEMKEFCKSELLDSDYESNYDTKMCIVNCPSDVNNSNTLMAFAFNFHKILPDSPDTLFYRDYKWDADFRVKNEILNIINRSITNNQFEIYYQPVYSVTEKRYVAAEALLRMHDYLYGDISPAIFIPAAEANGNMREIGNYVFENVFDFMSRHNLKDYGIERIHINISVVQCAESSFIADVRRLIKKYSIKTDTICFEIKEELGDYDIEEVDRTIKTLNELGIAFALDDYGTKYSDIERITRLPFQLVKLDKSFIDNVDDSSVKVVVEDTIKMFKAMDKKILVEGVENGHLASVFESLGCDYMQGQGENSTMGAEYMQGFYFSKAIPEDEFIELVSKGDSQVPVIEDDFN